MYLLGRVGQVLGPFDTSDLLMPGGAINMQTPEETLPVLVKLGVQAAVGTVIEVNGKNIKIGKTGIYELDEIVPVEHFRFPYGADADTIVDYVY